MHGHHVSNVSVGDSTSFRVPRIDRTLTSKHLPCIVVEIVEKVHTLYHFSVGDFELFTSSFGFRIDDWKRIPNRSLKEAAKLRSLWNSFSKSRCNCKTGKCSKKRCSYERSKIECSTHCHHGLMAIKRRQALMKIEKMLFLMCH